MFERQRMLAPLLTEAGFLARVVPLEHSEVEAGSHEVFVATKTLSASP